MRDDVVAKVIEPYLRSQFGKRSRSWALTLWLAAEYGAGNPVGISLIRSTSDKAEFMKFVAALVGPVNSVEHAFQRLLKYVPDDSQSQTGWALAEWLAATGKMPEDHGKALEWWRSKHGKTS